MTEKAEIIEEGITKIYYTRGRYLREVVPAGQRAKWFRDELGRLWCKFDHGVQVVTDIVVPASSIAEVQYKK